MIELQLLWAWGCARVRLLREQQNRDSGFTTLEWMAIAGVVVAAAIVVAAVLMNKAKNAASSVNVQ